MPDSDGSGAASTAVAGASGSQTVLEEEAEGERGAASPTVIKLKLKKPPATRRVQWTEDTVDNEHMNKKVKDAGKLTWLIGIERTGFIVVIESIGFI